MYLAYERAKKLTKIEISKTRNIDRKILTLEVIFLLFICTVIVILTMDEWRNVYLFFEKVLFFSFKQICKYK